MVTSTCCVKLGAVSVREKTEVEEGRAVHGEEELRILPPRTGAPAAETNATLGDRLAAAVLEVVGLPAGGLRRRRGWVMGRQRGKLGLGVPESPQERSDADESCRWVHHNTNVAEAEQSTKHTMQIKATGRRWHETQQSIHL
jgi:hypothetical protein